MFKQTRKTYSLLVLSLTLTAVAQAADNPGQHAGDVQPWKVGVNLLSNGQLFVADFGDLPGGLYATRNPGFDVDTARGGLTVGNWLRFQPQAALKYWNGSLWVANVPNGERITIKDALENNITFSATGVSGGLGVIGVADKKGDVHEHVDISLLEASGALGGSVGAYLIEFKLFETPANSDTPTAVAEAPITWVFNRGLDAAAFTRAVDALENALFDDKSGILDIKDVQVGSQHYAVQLWFDGKHFELKDYKAAAQQQRSFAQYDLTSNVLTIPSVKAFGKYFRVTLQNIGDFKFNLTQADEI